MVAEAEKVTAETVKGEWPQAAPRLYFLETDTTFSAVGKFLDSGKDTFPDIAHSVPRRSTSWNPTHLME